MKASCKKGQNHSQYPRKANAEMEKHTTFLRHKNAQTAATIRQIASQNEAAITADCRQKYNTSRLLVGTTKLAANWHANWQLARLLL